MGRTWLLHYNIGDINFGRIKFKHRIDKFEGFKSFKVFNPNFFLLNHILFLKDTPALYLLTKPTRAYTNAYLS